MRLVVAGDSVHWGQGLLPEHKFATIVAGRLGASLELIAHSGAIIGARQTDLLPAVDPEVPFAHPTILHQCERFTNNPAQVDVVLLNGGINDLDVRTIINPLTPPAVLSALIATYCGSDMRVLIERAARTFTRARLVVTSYFPIFSHASHLPSVELMLNAHFIDMAPQLAERFAPTEDEAEALQNLVWNKVVALALQFWHESMDHLRAAVQATQAQGPAAGRVTFVEFPFTERNAMFAPEPWLFGLNPDLSPQDEVSETRIPACRRVHAGDPLGAWACSIASAGHPNRVGEQACARAILDSLI